MQYHQIPCNIIQYHLNPVYIPRCYIHLRWRFLLSPLAYYTTTTCILLYMLECTHVFCTRSKSCFGGLIEQSGYLVSLCRKSALFWIRAVILLFRAEILPCGPPLLPHSCAEPFLGVVQKYSFPGDIFTSATWSVYRYSHWPVFSFWCQLDVVVFEGWSRTRSARVAAAPARSLLSLASLHLSSPGSSWSYIFGL